MRGETQRLEGGGGVLLDIKRSIADDTIDYILEDIRCGGASSISLANNTIKLDILKDISRLLCRAAAVRKLDLSGSHIQAQGAEDLAQVLRSKLPLRQLYLGNNGLADQGTAIIAGALPDCPTLLVLDLSANSISASGATALDRALTVNCQLTSLDLSWNNLGPEGAQALATPVADNQTLRTLNLQHNKLGNEGAWALADALNENFVLETLNLKGNQIEDAGALAISEALMDNLILVHLDLSWNRIGDGGAVGLSDALKVNESLSSLDLSYNRIGREGAESLADVYSQNPSLTELKLRENRIGDNGASALASTLGDDTATQLRLLDVSGNSIGDAGITALSIALIGNNTLTALDVSNNQFTERGTSTLLSGLESNTTLSSLFLRRARLQGFELFRELKSSLGVDSVSPLKVLDLSHIVLSESALRNVTEALALNTSVEQLSLRSCGVTKEGAKAIKDLLAGNRTLKELDLSSNQLQDEGLEAIATAFSQGSNLSFLYLGDNGIGDNGLSLLASALSLSPSCPLENLALPDNCIGDEGAHSLSLFFKETRHCHDLDLGNNRIGQRGASALLSAVVTNRVILVLSLAGNPVENPTIMEHIKWATQVNRGLTESRRAQRDMESGKSQSGGTQSSKRELESSLPVSSPAFSSSSMSSTGDGSVQRSISLRPPIAAPSPSEVISLEEDMTEKQQARSIHWSERKIAEWTRFDVLSWMVWLGSPSEIVRKLCGQKPTGQSLPGLIDLLTNKSEFATVDDFARKGALAALKIALECERWPIRTLRIERKQEGDKERERSVVVFRPGDEKFWSVDQVSSYLSEANVTNPVIEQFVDKGVHGPLLTSLSLHELDELLPSTKERPERRAALKALSKVTETALGMMQSDRSNRKVERILTATSRRSEEERELESPPLTTGGIPPVYEDPELLRLNSVSLLTSPPLYDDFSGGIISAVPQVQYDAFHVDPLQDSGISQSMVDASRSIVRSASTQPPVESSWLSSSTVSPSSPSAFFSYTERKASGSSVYPEASSVDAVKFSAFAPPIVQPESTFSLDIWAFLPRQREEMLLRAFESGGSERSPLTSLSIRRGALVTIALTLPFEHFTIDEDGGNSKWFTWTGEVTKVPFNVRCKGPRGGLTQVPCVAKIIVGHSVAVLQFSIIIGDQISTPSLLDSRLEVPPLSFSELDYREIELRDYLAKGNFGEAYLGEYKGQKVVVKKLLSVPSDDQLAALKHEAALLNHFGHHPNIVSFVGACTEPGSPLCVVTEYVEGGSVEDRVYLSKHRARGSEHEEKGGLTMKLRTKILRDAACGIVNVHEGNVLHRDIAARNCLLTSEMRTKICDFGLSRSQGSERVLRGRGFGPLKWMAPESIRPPHLFSQASDAYMFGLLCWEVLAGVEPYPGIPAEEAVRMKLEGAEIRLPSASLPQLQPEHERILAACLQHQPEKRPSLGRVLEDLDVLLQKL